MCAASARRVCRGPLMQPSRLFPSASSRKAAALPRPDTVAFHRSPRLPHPLTQAGCRVRVPSRLAQERGLQAVQQVVHQAPVAVKQRPPQAIGKNNPRPHQDFCPGFSPQFRLPTFHYLSLLTLVVSPKPKFRLVQQKGWKKSPPGEILRLGLRPSDLPHHLWELWRSQRSP